MTAVTRLARAERKAFLVARAELDRTKISLAVHEIRTIVGPGGSSRAAALRPFAATLVGITGPLLGFHRLARALRLVSVALFALRVARGWRG